MDLFSEKYVDNLFSNNLSFRERQELATISPKPNYWKLPYRSSYTKSSGEYGPNIEDHLRVYISY